MQSRPYQGFETCLTRSRWRGCSHESLASEDLRAFGIWFGDGPAPQFDPNADITITCTKGTESKQVTGKSPVQCPSGYQMNPMGPGQPGLPMQPAKQ